MSRNLTHFLINVIYEWPQSFTWSIIVPKRLCKKRKKKLQMIIICGFYLEYYLFLLLNAYLSSNVKQERERIRQSYYLLSLFHSVLLLFFFTFFCYFFSSIKRATPLDTDEIQCGIARRGNERFWWSVGWVDFNWIGSTCYVLFVECICTFTYTWHKYWV